MNKAFLSIAFLAAGLMIASCGNNKKPEPQKPAEQAQPEAQAQPQATETQATAEEATPVNTEDRAWYTVDIPTNWEVKQYVSEMTAKKEGAELNFKEQAKADVEKWIENIGKDAEKTDAISTGDITWNLFKNGQGFKTIYVAQVKDGVVRVGSSIDNPNDPEVLNILATVKGK